MANMAITWNVLSNQCPEDKITYAEHMSKIQFAQTACALACADLHVTIAILFNY